MESIRLLAQEIRYHLRQWSKAPGFAITAVLTMAIGIGGVAAAFSITDTVLLRPLPFTGSQQLVTLHEEIEHGPGTGTLNMPAPDVIRMQREQRVFTGVAGFIGADYEFSGRGGPFRAQAERVSASLLPVLGAAPLLGRNFTEGEDQNAIPVALISYGLWKDRFGADPHAVGSTIALDR